MGVDPGLRVRTPGVPHGSEAVIPLPGIERGAQAGIEPATGAWVTRHIGSAASSTDHVHTVALEDVPPCGRAPPVSRIRVWRRARATSASMMQVCDDSSRPGEAECFFWRKALSKGAYAILRAPVLALLPSASG